LSPENFDVTEEGNADPETPVRVAEIASRLEPQPKTVYPRILGFLKSLPAKKPNDMLVHPKAESDTSGYKK